MPNWEEIRREWETTKITFKVLAEKHGVKEGTLKSRRSREGWVRGTPKKDATKSKKDATIPKKMQPKKEQFEPVVESDELTDKQRLFCIYYIKYFNATKAYQKAYECDYMTAQSIAYRLMGNDGVKAEIQRLKTQRLNDAYFDKFDVLQKYKDIAFADITDFVEFGQEKRPELDHNLEPMIDEDGNEVTWTLSYVNFKNQDEVDGTLITEVKKGKDGVSVKLADKMKALEMLAKYTDLLSDNDKKRLQAEKLKADTAKAEAEVAKLANENKQVAPPTITIVDAWSDDDE